MKVMKSMKKLKFWSRKKKKKINFPENQPSNCHCCCQNHHFQPSAPPLPPWLDYEQTHAPNLAGEFSSRIFSGFPSSSEAQFVFAPQENGITPANEVDPLLPALPATSTNSTSCSSYQQYLSPNPVYGLPVVPPPRRDNLGANLIRCFCSCFRV